MKMTSKMKMNTNLPRRLALMLGGQRLGDLTKLKLNIEIEMYHSFFATLIEELSLPKMKMTYKINKNCPKHT